MEWISSKTEAMTVQGSLDMDETSNKARLLNTPTRETVTSIVLTESWRKF